MQQNFNEYFSSDIFPSKNIEGIKNWEKNFSTFSFFCQQHLTPKNESQKSSPPLELKLKDKRKRNLKTTLTS
jgi:hypothetical protein